MKKTYTAEDLMSAGVHYGYSRTRRHPTTTPFIYGNKNGTDIIDTEKTMAQITAAASFVAELGAQNKSMLFVGVKPEARAAVIETAQALNQPYVTERWIGGMLTNFGQMKHRIQKLNDMKEKRASGDYEKYTKKEQMILNRELDRLNKYFSGMSQVTKMPDVVIVIDSKKEHIAITEARKMNIPVIAISNTDCSIRGITYPILANDGSASSVALILDILKGAFQK